MQINMKFLVLAGIYSPGKLQIHVVNSNLVFLFLYVNLTIFGGRTLSIIPEKCTWKMFLQYPDIRAV